MEMAKKQKGGITVGQLMTQLEANPEFVARRQEQERLLADRIALRRADEAPIRAELHEVGVDIQDVSDLANTAAKYDAAIPVLLKHLLLPYSEKTKEFIARALAVREARYAWPILLSEYRKAPVVYKKATVKDGLAVALAAIVTDATMEELVALANDKSQGPTRILFLSALKKSKNPLAKQALVELASDPELATEIASWAPSKKRST